MRIPGCTFLPFSKRLAKLSLHSLRHRRLVTDLSTLFSLISGHTCASLFPHVIFIPPSVTRSPNLQIYVPILTLSTPNKTSCCVSRLPGITYLLFFWLLNPLNYSEIKFPFFFQTRILCNPRFDFFIFSRFLFLHIFISS